MNGTQFREARLRLGETQGTLARKLGVDPMTVSRWERAGDASVPITTELAMHWIVSQQRIVAPPVKANANDTEW